MVLIVCNAAVYDIGIVANIRTENWPFNMLMHLFLSNAGFVEV